MNIHYLKAIDLLSSRDRLGIRMAIKAALECPPSQMFYLGASAVQGSRFLANTFNLMDKTHTSGCGFSSTLHAEARLLTKLQESEYPHIRVYVVRLNSTGHIRTARPCQECMDKLVEAGIGTIIYSKNTGFEIEQIS